MSRRGPAELRQALDHKLTELRRLLEPFFERAPIFPGYFQVYERVCGKPSCRCTRGHLHRSTRVLIPFRDGQAALSVKPEEIESWKTRTEAYKRLREARRGLRQWQAELWDLLEELEKSRRSTEGLRPQDRHRELR